MILRETYQVGSREQHATSAGPSIEAARFLHEQLTHASPDLLGDLPATFREQVLSEARSW